MSFKKMIEDLKAQGLLDENHGLTQKGHDYVEEIKQKYKADTKEFNPQDGEFELVGQTGPRKEIRWSYK